MGAEIISMLTAKQKFFLDSGAGGIASLTGMDVAGALAGTHRFGYLLLLAKYADDNAAMNRLWQEIADEIQAEKSCDPKQANGLALCALFFVVNPCLCKHCKGRGVIYPRLNGKTLSQAARECDECGGTGRGKVSGRQRAALAQVPETTWRDTWRAYIDRKERWLLELETASIGVLMMHLREPTCAAAQNGL